jgi:hypothetical protein
MPHISYFQRRLFHDRSEGKWVIGGKVCDMKKNRPEAFFTPS